MNLEEVKRAGPSYPQDTDWGFSGYCRYLEKHPDYEIAEGDILIYLIGCFPDDLTAAPVVIYTSYAGTRLLRVGVFNPETYQCLTSDLKYHRTHYPIIGFYNS